MHNPDSKKSCAIIYKGCVFVQRDEGSTKYFEDAPFIPNRDNICSFYCYLKGVSKHVKALTISKQLKTTVLLNINKTSCKKGMGLVVNTFKRLDSFNIVLNTVQINNSFL